MNRFHGKRALVTGGSTGIGRAVASSLCSRGVRTVIAARRAGPLAEAAQLMGAQSVCTDLTGDAAAGELAAAAMALLGGLDILVLASGAYLTGEIRERSSGEFNDMLAANLLGPAALARACLPALEAVRGDIVFVNSTVTRASSIAGRAMFAAGNHALKAIADGLREEVNAQGVRVASIFPGTTATDRIARVMANSKQVYAPERLLQPQDVAQAVVALLALGDTAEVTDLYIRPRLKS
jgi:NADP-dependent 3-hydroxy acid dehydrogenase YdfG